MLSVFKTDSALLVLLSVGWGKPGLYCSFSGNFTSKDFLLTLVLFRVLSGWILLSFDDLFSDLTLTKSGDWQLAFEFFNFEGECGVSSSKFKMSSKKLKSGLIAFFFELGFLIAHGVGLGRLVFFKDLEASVERIS